MPRLEERQLRLRRQARSSVLLRGQYSSALCISIANRPHSKEHFYSESQRVSTELRSKKNTGKITALRPVRSGSGSFIIV